MIARIVSNRVEIAEGTHPVEALKLCMTENGHSQRQLAELIGTDRGNLSKILSMQLGISKELAAKLGTFYDIDPSVFILNMDTSLHSANKESLLRQEKFLAKELDTIERSIRQAIYIKENLERDLQRVRKTLQDI